MADRPILFSAPMIRALLDGRKTQTRRLITFAGIGNVLNFVKVATDPQGRPVYEMKDGAGNAYARPSAPGLIDYQYSTPIGTGDRLWVREAWRTQEAFDAASPSAICHEFEEEWGAPSIPTFYVADGKCDDHSVEQWQESALGRLRASMHMPRCASRLTLIVTDVRVERLQDISEADAIAEGILRGDPLPEVPESKGIIWSGGAGDISDPFSWTRSPVSAYRDLWNHINGPGAWGANPWVAAYTFAVHNQNIDQVAA